MPFKKKELSLRASLHPLTILHIAENDLSRLSLKLKQWQQEAPKLFEGMPLLIELPNTLEDINTITQIIACVREFGLVPVGLQSENPKQQSIARQLQLATFSSKTQSKNNKLNTKKDSLQHRAHHQPTILDVVRSGQQIHVNGDLIVLGSVSAGAEVSAKGHIHIYGALLGRALAGTANNKTACIFCQEVKAELVAIAGCYWQYEDLQRASHTRNVCIYLADEALRIRSLG